MNILNKSIMRRNLIQTSVKTKIPLSLLHNFKHLSYKVSLSCNIPSVSEKNCVKSQNNVFYMIKRNSFSSNLPKHSVLNMPNLSPTMKLGKIVAWNKKEGDAIKAGESLASIETDKAVVDYEMTDEGYVAKILLPAGTKDVQIGTPVAIIVDEKADIDAFKNYTVSNSTSSAPKESQAAPQTPAPQTPAPQTPAPQTAGSSKSYPKHIKLNMPTLSPTMSKGKIVEWRKKEGDFIKPGEALAGIETDKAQVDYELNEEGYIAKLLYPSGAKDVNVGSLIAILVEEKNDVGAFKDFSGDSKSTSTTSSTGSTGSTSSTSSTPASEPTKQVSSTQSSGDRLFASPLARKTARENEISLEGLKGSGPRGRIIQADVLEAKEKGVKEIKTPQVQPESLQTQKVSTPQPSHVDYEDLEISGIRQVTAERLTYSKTQIPHFYLNMEINVDKISALRTELNKHSPVKLSFNDLIIKAASLACIKVPETNSSWQGSFIRRYKNVDMSVAVQTDHGLMTPIITNTNLKGLAQISKEMKDLAERAKERKLKPQEFQGGTFTISNMGMMGISSFSAVINPPQACILAVGKSEKKVLYDENAKDKNAPYKLANMMNCTLSCDHRVVDGAYGAKWIEEFKKLVENPELMLL